MGEGHGETRLSPRRDEATVHPWTVEELVDHLGALVDEVKKLVAEIHSLRIHDPDTEPVALRELSVDADDAAEMLGVSDHTVREWVRLGRLGRIPHTGRRVLIARRELERFVAQGVLE